MADTNCTMADTYELMADTYGLMADTYGLMADTYGLMADANNNSNSSTSFCFDQFLTKPANNYLNVVLSYP